MSKRFENKIVLITGAGSGIGRATSIEFAKEGAILVLADMNVGNAADTLKMTEEFGTKGIVIEVDVSSSQSVQAMVKKTIDTYGRLDVAFNNAGIHNPGPLLTETTEEEFDKIVAVNLKGCFLSMKYEIPEMIKNGGGTIVNTASVGGVVGAQRISAYIGAKHGVVGLTKSAALEFIREGVRITAVCPGATNTAMLADYLVNDEAARAIAEKHPIGRLAQPIEIARAVLFLASSDASFYVGHPLLVEGGDTLN